MTPKQKEQFNKMRNTLKRIATGYMTPQQIKRDSNLSGLNYSEYLEMTYENIQQEAKTASKNVRAL